MAKVKSGAVAVYTQVSSRQQSAESQGPDLEQWLKAYADGAEVLRLSDEATGKTMDRPGFAKLMAAVRAGKVKTVLVWRLDRLGRTVSGLAALFEELQTRKVDLVSVKDGLNLGTPSGRLVANVLASVAAYETEVRGERVAAGQAVARANGKTWGGPRKGGRPPDQGHPRAGADGPAVEGGGGANRVDRAGRRALKADGLQRPRGTG